MLLSKFFEHIKQTKTLPRGKVFCFSAASYPLLFFSHLILYFKRNGIALQTLNCAGTDSASIKAILSTMSFSGEHVYWLDGFYTLPEKKQQEIMHYLYGYEGPHRVILFSDKITSDNIPKSSDAVDCITLPQNITLQDFSAVRFLVSDNLHDKSAFASQLTMYSDYLSFDNVCLLAHYELVLGSKIADDFFAQWITRIIDPTSSLFVLSQHFFCKKTKQFFRQWAAVSDHYMPAFWAIFWADQIWRAYVYCDLMRQQKHAEAKKAQYKLPFSFINRDWSQYNLAELRNAHQFLTTLDFRLKNGNSDLGLDHFYAQFFENQFRVNPK